MADINCFISNCGLVWWEKIRSLGSDLGEGLKGFKKAIKDEDVETTSQSDLEDK